MARLPSRFDLSAPQSGRSGRGIASYDVSAIGRGVASLGGAISDIGADITRQRTATEGIAADGGATKEMNDFVRGFEQDGDYQTFSKRAEEGLGRIRQTYASKITNPAARAQWEAEYNRRAETARNSIADLGESKVRESKLVDAKTGLQGYQSVIANPDASETDRSTARRNAEASIGVLQQNGLLDPSEADTWRQDVINGGDFVYGQRQIERDPSIITGKLPAKVSDRAKTAMDFFQSRGWTKEQAAGIIGNLLAESTLNTGALNAGDGSDGSNSIGIGQWNSGRAAALKQFAADHNADWQDFGIQLAFVEHELNTNEKSAGDALRNAKDIQSATDAMVMYERPAGSQQGARNAHNYSGRLKFAQQAAGETIKPDWYQNQSPEKQLQLENMAQARDQQIIAQDAVQRKAIQTQANDDYRLRIAAADPTLTQQAILDDQRIDNGDKATLLNTYNEKNKEDGTVNSFIANLASGEASVNLFDADERKVANKAYDKVMKLASPEQQPFISDSFIAESGYIPPPVQADLRRGAESTDPAEMAAAMSSASRLQQSAPIAFNNFEGGATVRKNLDLFQTYTNAMGYSSDEAAARVISANDPEKMRQRDALLKSEPVKKLIKDTGASQVAAIFDKGLWSSAPKVGENPAAEAAMVADYRSILEESLVDSAGDVAVATELAGTRFGKIYSPSTFTTVGPGVVVKYPPEKAYPAAPDGTHDYVREQLASAMKEEGIEADQLYLQADENTAQDIKSGKPARYQVFYEKDGKMERYYLPFYADPVTAQQQFKQKRVEQIKGLEQRMFDNRSQFVRETEEDNRSYDETVGPDWMKAQQMLGQQERRRQDQTIEELGGPADLPINGGGGGGY